MRRREQPVGRNDTSARIQPILCLPPYEDLHQDILPQTTYHFVSCTKYATIAFLWVASGFVLGVADFSPMQTAYLFASCTKNATIAFLWVASGFVLGPPDLSPIQIAR